MKIYVIYLMLILLTLSCVSQQNIQDRYMQVPLVRHGYYMKNNSVLKNQFTMYDSCITRCAYNYRVDASLVKAIIKVESNYDPAVVSKSNAVGLMQLKPETAGRDAYRLKGLQGEPSVYDLKNAAINIDLGVAYLSILQKQLAGIVDTKTRRYAIIVAYVNGLSALLQIFSINRSCAIKKINKLNSEQFYQYIQYHHPSQQAQRYLSKVNECYLQLKM